MIRGRRESLDDVSFKSFFRCKRDVRPGQVLK